MVDGTRFLTFSLLPDVSPPEKFDMEFFPSNKYLNGGVHNYNSATKYPNPLQLLDRVLNFLPRSHLVELFLDGSVESLANSIRLGMPCLCLGVINILNGQVQLIFMVLQRTTKLCTPIGQNPQQSNILSLVER